MSVLLCLYTLPRWLIKPVSVCVRPSVSVHSTEMTYKTGQCLCPSFCASGRPCGVNPKALRLLGRHKWNFACIFHGSGEQTFRKTAFCKHQQISKQALNIYRDKRYCQVSVRLDTQQPGKGKLATPVDRIDPPCASAYSVKRENWPTLCRCLFC